MHGKEEWNELLCKWEGHLELLLKVMAEGCVWVEFLREGEEDPQRGRLIKKPFMKHSDPDRSCCTVFLRFSFLFVFQFISLHCLSRSLYAFFGLSNTLCGTKLSVKYIPSRTKQRQHLKYLICQLIPLLATHLDITHHTKKTHPLLTPIVSCHSRIMALDAIKENYSIVETWFVKDNTRIAELHLWFTQTLCSVDDEQ